MLSTLYTYCTRDQETQRTKDKINYVQTEQTSPPASSQSTTYSIRVPPVRIPIFDDIQHTLVPGIRVRAVSSTGTPGVPRIRDACYVSVPVRERSALEGLVTALTTQQIATIHRLRVQQVSRVRFSRLLILRYFSGGLALKICGNAVTRIPCILVSALA